MSYNTHTVETERKVADLRIQIDKLTDSMNSSNFEHVQREISTKKIKIKALLQTPSDDVMDWGISPAPGA